MRQDYLEISSLRRVGKNARRQERRKQVTKADKVIETVLKELEEDEEAKR